MARHTDTSTLVPTYGLLEAVAHRFRVICVFMFGRLKEAVSFFLQIHNRYTIAVHSGSFASCHWSVQFAHSQRGNLGDDRQSVINESLIRLSFSSLFSIHQRYSPFFVFSKTDRSRRARASGEKKTKKVLARDFYCNNRSHKDAT